MDLQQIDAALYRLQIPIPVPLKQLNSYLLHDAEGWCIVDCGFHDHQTEWLWQEAVRTLGIRPRDITRIVVTHLHLDHIGCAGWLQRWTGARVLMHEREVVCVQKMMDARCWVAMEPFWLRFGAPPAAVSGMTEEHSAAAYLHTYPPPEPTPVAEGARLALGGRSFQAINLPGHCDGMMALWSAEDALLLAADAVLSNISPNVSLWPGFDPNPLRSFLTSLQRVAQLPAQRVLTGHRDPIADLPGRVAELQEHHRQRLTAIEAIIGRGATNPWEIAQELFGPQDNIYGIRFAFGETLSHLAFLETVGRLVRQDGSICTYHLP